MGETVPRAESEHEPTSWSQQYLINVLKTLSAYFQRDSADTLSTLSLNLWKRKCDAAARRGLGRADREKSGGPPGPRPAMLPCTPHARLAHVDRGRQAALCMTSFFSIEPCIVP
jgi:hypothetical protein